MEEIWKPIPSQPGMMASNLGRVILPEGTAKTHNGGVRKYTPKPTYGNVTKASKNARSQHRGIYNRKRGNMKVHRLVCEAFHGTAPFEKAVVMHLNEDGLDNRPENLRWGTQKQNLNAPGFVEYCKGRTGENSPSVKGRMKS